MFALNTVEDGFTYREMLEGLLGRARTPERISEIESELAVPPFPVALGYIWRAFCRLHARRSSGFTINPITWPDIDAFTRLSGQRLTPWEISLVEELDDLFRMDRSKTKDQPD